MKGLLPLATAVAVVAFVYVEFALNFTFHWVTDGDLGNGLSLPASFHLVVLGGLGEWFSIPMTFAAFASCVFWWIATGLDGWADHGGGIGNSVQALAKPATAGTGAFGGVISTPYGWVALNVFVTLLIGCRRAGALRPR
jgi:hypothetical protein